VDSIQTIAATPTETAAVATRIRIAFTRQKAKQFVGLGHGSKPNLYAAEGTEQNTRATEGAESSDMKIKAAKTPLSESFNVFQSS
jgi:hypothetical protein